MYVLQGAVALCKGRVRHHNGPFATPRIACPPSSRDTAFSFIIQLKSSESTLLPTLEHKTLKGGGRSNIYGYYFKVQRCLLRLGITYRPSMPPHLSARYKQSLTITLRVIHHPTSLTSTNTHIHHPRNASCRRPRHHFNPRLRLPSMGMLRTS